MRYLDVKEASEYLNVKPSTLYAWVGQGRIPFIKMNGLIRFDHAEIDRWVRSLRNGKPRAIPVVAQGSLHEDLDLMIARAKHEVYNPPLRGNQTKIRPPKGGNNGVV